MRRELHLVGDDYTVVLAPRSMQSVSAAAYPVLMALGDERKTRVFSDETVLEINPPGCTVNLSTTTHVFNRISDEMTRGVFERSGDTMQYARDFGSVCWFLAQRPNVIHWSSDGLLPLDSGAVIMEADEEAQFKETFTLPGFHAESAEIRHVYTDLSRSRVDNALMFELALYATSEQTPRLRAYAGQLLSRLPVLTITV